MPIPQNTIQTCLFELEVNTTLKGIDVPVETEISKEEPLEFNPPAIVDE